MKESSPEAANLRNSMAALEAQRSVLGDMVVDAALGPMREKLAALEAADRSQRQRKQVTILFADVIGFTAMSADMDAEEVTEMINRVWQQLDAVIVDHGGSIDKHIGDAVMAIWGAQKAREDDPEQAVRAALAMQEALGAIAAGKGNNLQMRIGLNTGPVLLGAVGTTNEVTAMGDTVNIASRLQHAAPETGVLIAHDTYRHVRGVFEVEPQSPLPIRGIREPVQTYLVKNVKERAFRIPTRGVEGIETRTIGRESELRRLQKVYQAMAGQPAQPRIVTVMAEAGVGKSRLLYELDKWLELLPQTIRYFKGRATPEMQNIPYSLLRDLFRFRFKIRDSDNPDQVREKFEAGTENYLEAGQAHLIGHVIGFNFSTTETVQNLSGSPSLGSMALAYLINYFQRLAKAGPVVIMLEDLHWADDASLEMVIRLGEELGDAHWLIICTSRPQLYERRPDWERGKRSSHLDLEPLSDDDSGALVDEILQHVEAVPSDLRRRITAYAAGNPYYIEEIVLMLLEEGVIIRETDSWKIIPQQLEEITVPSTLTGVLQARLDRMTPNDRATLQRAAVVGRFFWDAVLTELRAEDEPEIDVPAGLHTSQARELIFRRSQSSFAGTHEYVFKHAILRDVTYETVLLRLRRVYHRQVGDWLAKRSRERRSEYLGLIAEHYVQAGATDEAVDWLTQAGEQALNASNFREAKNFFQRALVLLPQESDEIALLRTRLFYLIGQSYTNLGDLNEASTALSTSIALAREGNNEQILAEGLSLLGGVATHKGEWDKAEALLEESLKLAEKLGNRKSLAVIKKRRGDLSVRKGEYESAIESYKDSLHEAREIADRASIADNLNNLGILEERLYRYAKAEAYYREAMAVFESIDYKPGCAMVLNNLGFVTYMTGDPAGARELFQKSLTAFRELGNRRAIAIVLDSLGDVSTYMGDEAEAMPYFQEGLEMAAQTGAISLILLILAGVARVQYQNNLPEDALETLGFVLNHPAIDSETRQRADQILPQLRSELPPEIVEAALERGRAKKLENVYAELQVTDGKGAAN